MKDATREDLQAHIATMRKHLLATEQAVALYSIPDVLLCVADLMEEAAKAGDLAEAEDKTIDQPQPGSFKRRPN